MFKSMNIYKCDVCGTISKPKTIFIHMNEIIEELPDNWNKKVISPSARMVLIN